MRIKKFIPLLDWIGAYDKSMLRGDLSAGLTVGVVLIPQGMAYALLAGLQPIYGLYASLIPLIIYGFLGTSRQLSVGPSAMVALLISAGLGTMHIQESQYLMLAILLAFMVGVIQFLLGIFKLGFIVNFLSHPVISGFTSAAAVIIFVGQIKYLLGIPIPRSHFIHEILGNIFNSLDLFNYKAFIIGLGGIAIILISRKISKMIPGQLIAVVFGILIVKIFNWQEDVAIIGDIKASLPSFGLPSINIQEINSLVKIALTISLISFVESIAVAKAVRARHKNYDIDPNQELIALGMANIGGSFFQSFAVTGGFSRTAINDQAGAKSGMASIISASLIAFSLLFLTPYFHDLPKAILGSVILVAIYSLIDIKEGIHLWNTFRKEFWMLIITFITTIVIGVEAGIGLGVVLSIALIIYKTTMPHFPVLGRIPNTNYYKNLNRFKSAKEIESVLIMRFDAQLYYANTSYFKEKLFNNIKKRKKEDKLDFVIIDADSINNIDSSGIQVLIDIKHELNAENIKLFFVGMKGPLRDAFVRTDFSQALDRKQVFFTIQNAIDCIKNNDCQKHKEKYSIQSKKTK